MRRASAPVNVAGGAPTQELAAEHDAGQSFAEHECAIGKLIERRLVKEALTGDRRDSLPVELCVDRISSALAPMKLRPCRRQPVIVRAAAERTWTMAGGQCGGLVEEEELGEATRLHQRRAAPATELQSARDPPLAAIAPADFAARVVQAAAVAIHEAARGGRDQLTHRRDAVAQRHAPKVAMIRPLSLTELHAANELLDDRAALAARHQQEGCLFVREAIDPGALAEVADQAAALLERWGVARHSDGVRATGASFPSVDPTELQRLPALVALVDQMAAGTDPFASVVAQVFGCPSALWPGARLHFAFPGDPARAIPPHQDSAALDWIGDYRRIWIALGDIPFGDGGLGLAAGSHRYRRLPMDELLDGNWWTAAMSIGDMLAFDLNLVHQSLPATSDRIRIALTMIGSAQWDPRPSIAAQDAGPSRLGLCEHEASPQSWT